MELRCMNEEEQKKSFIVFKHEWIFTIKLV